MVNMRKWRSLKASPCISVSRFSKWYTPSWRTAVLYSWIWRASPSWKMRAATSPLTAVPSASSIISWNASRISIIIIGLSGFWRRRQEIWPWWRGPRPSSTTEIRGISIRIFPPISTKRRYIARLSIIAGWISSIRRMRPRRRRQMEQEARTPSQQPLQCIYIQRFERFAPHAPKTGIQTILLKPR